jgi:excisionase family DNA binding protein
VDLVKLLSLSEAARLTSMSVSFWKKLAARGDVPTVQLGRARRIREEDFAAVCRSGLCRSAERSKR